jgi:hypothetical protein
VTGKVKVANSRETESAMKRSKVKKGLMSKGEVEALVERSMRLLPPPNIEQRFSEALAEAIEDQREDEGIKIKQKRKKLGEERKKLEKLKTNRSFHITCELMVYFYEASKIGPPFRDGLSRNTASKIAELMDDLKKPPGLSTIQECFKKPESVTRPKAALRARQLVCNALGKRSGAFSSQDGRVSVRDEQALTKRISRFMGSAVGVEDLEEALEEAVLVAYRARKRGKI